MTDPDNGKPPASARTNIPSTTRAAIWQAHNRRCAYTGEPLAFAELEIDHIIPVAAPADEIDRMKSEGIIAEDFDLNGLGNLLPTTRFQNSRKRANLRSTTALLHFLAVASQYRRAAETYIAASTDESRLLNAYLQMKAQADRNDLSVDDVMDIHRQQVEGLTRLRHAPELANSEQSTLLNAELARALLTKPFALGGGGITEVVLQDDEDNQTRCHDCETFLKAKDEGLWPMSQFDINCHGMADRNCEMLRALERARYAPMSMIRYPRVTCADLDRWSSDWVRQVWIEFDEEEDGPLFERCPTIADLVKAGACEVIEASEWRFDVEPAKGFALSVKELLRADLDNDGAEEILVFDLTYAPHGTLRAGTVAVAKPSPDGLIRPVT